MVFCLAQRSRARAWRVVPAVLAILVIAFINASPAAAQGKTQVQSSLSNLQRLDIMRSKLEAMRRSLESAISGLNAKDSSDGKKNPDDPRERLRGLDKEVGSVLSEVNDLHSKEERSEKYDGSKLDGLETSVSELSPRVEAGLQSTAGARTSGGATATSQPKPEKSKRRLLIFPGKSTDKYAELTGAVAPGRDRILFIEAAKEVRKGNHDTGRLLFTTIILAYPESPYLALAKLAIADSFYLEGTTSSLIQAGQAYQDWLTFFPTDWLTCSAMLKVAETEMRQMGLSDRDISHARKAEQRLKVMLQQCPQSTLRADADLRLRETQDNLAMHNLMIARFYFDSRYRPSKGVKGGLKGSQDRLKEIVDKYSNFCLMDEVLFRYATTFQEEEEPDEAAKLYQRLVRDYPTSEFVDKAKDQLKVIGAAIPDPDPIKKDLPQCEKPTFVENMKQQISGSANVTTSRDGILITRHGEGTDLIDKAIANNGSLAESQVQPVIQRSAPTPTPNQTSPSSRPRSVQTPTPQP